MQVVVRRRTWILVVGVLAAGAVFALPPGTNDEIEQRLQPFGEVCRSGDDCGGTTISAAGGPMSGQQVYDQFCFACHSTGVGGAPTLGDDAAWATRRDKGMEELMRSTLNGVNAMPPKGTCMTCSDDELGQAVTYMLDAT